MGLLTRKEAAARLRIALRTLDRRLASGEIKCHRLGYGPRAPVRISEAELKDYLESAANTVNQDAMQSAKAIMGK
jgi:excisionase family DNA binding protein